MDQENTPAPGFGARLGKALLWLLRLFVVVVLGIAIGVGGYLGGMFVYRQYWEPVPVHTIRIDILEGRQKQTVEQLTEQRDELLGRVGELERQSDARMLALDQLRERLAAVETPQASERARLDAAYAELEQLQEALALAQPTREAMLAALDALQAVDADGQLDREALRADFEAQQAALADLERALKTAQDERAAIEAGVADLSEQLDANSLDLVAMREELSGPNSPAALRRELQQVTAMQWLIRARLVLVQNNLGLAQADLQATRRVLAALQADLPTAEAAQIAQVIDRVDAALGYLPGAPVAAADELEGAWQLLVSGLAPVPSLAPAEEAGLEVTPEVGPTTAPETTSTPVGTPTATPETPPASTPEGTPASTPEATPTPTPQS